MAILKCKMCGGDIKVTADQNFGTCESCCTTSTIPKATDDQKANLFNRANHFRRLNDFDKATAAYESILNVDYSDSEAHWGLVLSKYGIEYVEDPVSHERIPTCHRVQKESILVDPDYLAALEKADGSYAKGLYESEAKQIAEIQKGILAISSMVEPYDVFICYKETTEGGSRTKDSALAQDVYYQLIQERFKVFFSRITLEDKLGQQYEPYIFAALRSAKVMIVIGTKPEYLNAVWVKNEWSRYLKLMKQDRKKLLIPCYRDMDAYDLPEELSILQSQDMSKIGFIQDLIRGVKKVVESEKHQERIHTSVSSSAAPGVDSLYKRVLLFLEDGDFQSATAYCDRILDISPEYAPAYAGKLCASLSMRKESDLVTASHPFSDNSNYKKAIRFDEVGYSAKLMGYNQAIEERVETTRKQNVYDTALNQKNKIDLSKTDSSALRNCGTEYGRLAEVFDIISSFSDAGLRSAECKQLSEEYLDKAEYKVEQDRIEAARTAEECRIAKERVRIDLEQKREADRIEETRIAKRKKKIAGILSACSIVIIGVVVLLTLVIIPAQGYAKAEKQYAEGNYTAAVEAYESLGSYKDSASKLEEIYAKHTRELIKGGMTRNIPLGGYKWRILTNEGGKALLITEDVIEERPYACLSRDDISWENCSLRAYLNGEFYNSFSSEEKSIIAETKNNNPYNPTWGTPVVKYSTDKIFLLNLEEANQYFIDDKDRQSKNNDSWWLRSPAGWDAFALICVGYNGIIDTHGGPLYDDTNGVRPALWLNLTS